MGRFSVFAEFASELGDEVIDGAGGGARVIPPNGVEKLFAGDNFASVLDEEGEDATLFGVEADGFAIDLTRLLFEIYKINRI